jgi:hypothetical protein
VTRRDGLEEGFASELSDVALVLSLVDPSSEMGSSRRIPFAGSFVFGLHTLVMTQNPEAKHIVYERTGNRWTTVYRISSRSQILWANLLP